MGNQKDLLGEHYIVDTQRHVVVAQRVDVEELARELGLLKPFESVASR